LEKEVLKPARERYTCWKCREPIGHRDYVGIREEIEGKICEVYYCVPCGRGELKSFAQEKSARKEARKRKIIVRWYGKTWAYEIPLYLEEGWETFMRGLAENSLFPLDTIQKQKEEIER